MSVTQPKSWLERSNNHSNKPTTTCTATPEVIMTDSAANNNVENTTTKDNTMTDTEIVTKTVKYVKSQGRSTAASLIAAAILVGTQKGVCLLLRRARK